MNGILEAFVADKKIFYECHIVGIVNYHRHNGMMNNPKYRAAIRKSIDKLDEPVRTLFCARLPIDTQSIPNRYPIRNRLLMRNAKLDAISGISRNDVSLTDMHNGSLMVRHGHYRKAQKSIDK